MKLILDLDGILADWHKAIFSIHGYIFNRNDIRPGNYNIIDLFKKYSDGKINTYEQMWQPCNKEFWSEIPKTKDADEIMEIITKFFDYDNICLMTYFPIKYGYPLSKVGECLDGKIKWILDNFPKLINHFQLGTSKHFSANRNTILIDDSDLNVHDFFNHYGKAILYPREWNSNHQFARNNLSVEYLKKVLESSI